MQNLSQDLEQDDMRNFRHQIGSPIASSPPGISVDSCWFAGLDFYFYFYYFFNILSPFAPYHRCMATIGES